MNQMTRPEPTSASAPGVMPDPETCWAAFMGRDRAHDDRFVGAVKSTGIYCKPSCPARHPKRENIAFYPNGAAARAAGYRACLRCKPDEVGRDVMAVAAAIRLIEDAEEAPSLAMLAEQVGYAPHHFHRLFKRETGSTPAAYARGLRTERLKAALHEEDNVTQAIYAAGYNAPSRAYADAGRHLGMTPSAWRDGGKGTTIRFALRDSSLGKLLVAATEKGLCRISFDEDAGDLARLFPKAEILPADARTQALAIQVLALVDDPAGAADLPLDVAGTAFQQAVWAALRAIPAGETRTYKQIAAAVGKPEAVRATGTACGDNRAAVLIPCHRVLRSDGGLGGYAYGLERKKALLNAEGRARQR
ncbi:MAG: bifunctional DNA-binding transcriptional regulator/O6-methylguanine-DNA methyltransferase Ada [Sphingobium sp.]